MKILSVTHSAAISGGANRSLFALLLLLRERHGVEVEVLLPESDGKFLRALRAEGIVCHTAWYPSCCTSYRGTPRDILRFAKLVAAPLLSRMKAYGLKKRLEGGGYDLIHTNERNAMVGAFLASELGVPHLWHVRSFGVEIGNHYSPGVCRAMNRYADRIVVISSALQRDLERKIPKEKLLRIYNGIPLERPALPRIPHSGFRLLLTGRIVPAKGHMEALQALSILRERGHADARLHVAGSVPTYGSARYVQKMRRWIERNGLAEAVVFHGEVQDMRALRAQMDVELLCCRAEAFGRVTVEGMRAGLTVVGADTGATPELIRNGDNGLLYRQGSCEDLAEKLIWVRGHPAEAAQMAMRGQREASSRFLAEQNAAEVFAEMKRIVGESIMARR